MQQHPKSFLERTEEFAEKVLWGGKCLRCPSFQGATLFIVTLSDHIVPKESHEGASKQSGFSAPFCTPLSRLWNEVEPCDPACHVVSSAFWTLVFHRDWFDKDQDILYLVRGVRLSVANSATRVLGLATELPFGSVFPIYETRVIITVQTSFHCWEEQMVWRRCKAMPGRQCYR